MIVYSEGDGAYADAGRRLAARIGAEYVHSGSQIGDEFVYYVARPEAIDTNTVLELQRRLLEKGPEDGGFTILTGNESNNVVDLHSRSGYAGDEHALVLRDGTKDWYSYDDAATVLTGEDASAATLASLAGDLQSVSMFVHGRAMHLFLDDGYVCGFPSDADANDFSGRQPYCVTEGGMDCPLEGTPIHADSIDVNHLFVDSCASLLPSTDFTGTPVHVGMELLESVCSLIGTYRQINSLPQMSALHYALLRAGYDTVERCYLLNRAAHSYRTAMLPYVPLGQPDATVSDPTCQRFEVEGRAEDGLLRLTGIDTHVVDVTLPGWADEPTFVRNRTDSLRGSPLYYASFVEDGSTRVLLYTWGRLEVEQLELEIDTTPVSAVNRRTVERCHSNLERTSKLYWIDDKSRGQLKDLGNRLFGLSSDLGDQRYHTNAHAEIDERIQRMSDAVERIEDRILSKVVDGDSVYISDTYGSDLREADVRVADERCGTCDEPLFLRWMTDASRSITRLRGICPRCGIVFDVPDSTGDSITYPSIRGEFVPVTGDECAVRVEFTNPTDESASVVCLPWLGTDDDRFSGNDAFDSGQMRRQFAPGESHEFDLTLDVSDVENNEYWIVAYLTCNCAVYQSLQKLVLGTEYGHLRPDLRTDL